MENINLLKDWNSISDSKFNEIIRSIQNDPAKASENKKLIEEIFLTELSENKYKAIRIMNAFSTYLNLKQFKIFLNYLLDAVSSDSGDLRRIGHNVLKNAINGQLSEIFFIKAVPLTEIRKEMRETYKQKKEEIEMKEKAILDFLESLVEIRDRESNKKIKDSLNKAIEKCRTTPLSNLVLQKDRIKLKKDFGIADTPINLFPESEMELVSPKDSISKNCSKVNMRSDKTDTIYEKENLYAEYLCTLEENIAHYFYYENKDLTDRELDLKLKKLTENFSATIRELAGDKFLEHIAEDLIIDLRYDPISEAELKAVMNYIRWAIDNRTYLKGDKTYLEWICYREELYSKTEEQKYLKKFYRICKEKGISKKRAETLLGDRDEEFLDEEDSVLESSKLMNMTTDEEITYVCNNITNNFNVFSEFLLKNAENLDIINEAYFKIEVEEPDFFILDILMSNYFKFRKNKDLERFHLRKARQKFDNLKNEMPRDLRESIEKDYFQKD